MRSAFTAVAILLVSAAPAFAQASDEPAWTLSAALYTYFVPDDSNYAQPTIAVDGEWFHLESRYNYEERNTGSFWVGFNTGGGETVAWSFTPMLGAVFGDVTGIAPGYNASLAWRKLDIYSEGEWLYDMVEPSDSFFYNWSEVSYVPSEWLRVGLVTQRTRAYETERDVQRGLLVGVSYGNLEAVTYVFNPDDSSPTVVLSLAWEFSR